MSYGMNGWNKPGGDTISRAAALEALDEINAEVEDGYGFQYEKWRVHFRVLPSAQPDVADTNVGDIISRAAAINVADAVWSVTGDKNVAKVWEQIKDLPPAQPGWIPCSERLPKDFEDVLVWYEYFRYGEYNRMYQTWDVGYYNSQLNIWGGGVTGQKVRAIAWMPLPEPYKGEEYE